VSWINEILEFNLARHRLLTVNHFPCGAFLRHFNFCLPDVTRWRKFKRSNNAAEWLQFVGHFVTGTFVDSVAGFSYINTLIETQVATV
jgi:hypothetical protein